jgi:hypothetical protein
LRVQPVPMATVLTKLRRLEAIVFNNKEGHHGNSRRQIKQLITIGS